MQAGTEAKHYASTPTKALQFSCFSAIHKLLGLQIVLVVLIFVYAIGTQQWGPGLGLDNLVFWYGISIVFCLLSIVMFAITDIYAYTAFSGFAIAFLVFNLLVFIKVLPQFWESCPEPHCKGVAGDFFAVFFVVLVGVIVVCGAVCYYIFRAFRLEGTNSKRVDALYATFSGPMRLRQNRLQKQTGVYPRDN
jgi:hypothetical protein